ncbi:gas vesicle protein GvpO [Polymorphospora rubra]|uniref:Gas vesicle synthesis protein GvpO n=1 Tax=Polymorphospora rubra TaxID=338584 RepID=A0A810NAL2_9ACTN|nr:gas vesicle protein GvpO [Polymorphospora rubra]BCJ70120.1 hypothetical protein Prubr_71410 [Polymorphospora rubra]
MPTTRGDRSPTRATSRRPRGEPDEGYDDRVRDDRAYNDDDDRDDAGSGRRRPRAEARSGLPASSAARAGLEYVAELTGKAPIGITSLERGESGWSVGVEVVEDRRVPSSGDILAVYVAELDDDGELLGYRRVRRYARGRGDAGGAG